MKEFTLVRNLTIVNSVASVLLTQDTLGYIKEFTVGKSLTNVNSVASVLAKQET